MCPRNSTCTRPWRTKLHACEALVERLPSPSKLGTMGRRLAQDWGRGPLAERVSVVPQPMQGSQRGGGGTGVLGNTIAPNSRHKFATQGDTLLDCFLEPGRPADAVELSRVGRWGPCDRSRRGIPGVENFSSSRQTVCCKVCPCPSLRLRLCPLCQSVLVRQFHASETHSNA